MSSTFAYTDECFISVPDKRLSEIPEGFHTQPLRGYAFTLAVVALTNPQHCIGYVLLDPSGRYIEPAPSS